MTDNAATMKENDYLLKGDMSLEDWLGYLEKQHSKTIELGLERIAQVAQRLELTRPAPRVFTVAGTNGKGTTCRMLEMMLLGAGMRVGVYSSPHLLRYTERVRIQGNELPASSHCEAFSHIEAQRGAVPLTYFEYGTLAALWLFKQARLDVVILEVGLGGRLDATNIVDADVAVITSIALDHTDWLGDNRESIGREKAGIFRAGKPAVVGEADIPDSIADVAGITHAQLLVCGKAWHYQAQHTDWWFADQQGKITGLPLPQIPLANAASALAALRVSGLAVSESAIFQAMESATLPGRFHVVRQRPRLILDVAHNPHAAACLAQRLALEEKTGQLRVVVGMLRDKDIAGTVANLSPVVDHWYCASLEGERAASAQQLAHYLPQSLLFDTVPLALRAAMAQASACDTVLVCGSFYTVAHALQMLDSGFPDGE